MSASIQQAAAGEDGSSIWLSRYAKLVVAATLWLLFLGGLVTSWGAGMAVPDWPMSFNSLNPDGWWTNFPVRLEHSHRLTAEFVAVLVSILVSWIWQNRWALPTAVVFSAAIPKIAAICGASKPVMMHLAIWPAAAAFVATIVLQSRGKVSSRPALIRWLSLALFVCICIQATLGGLRVTSETAGAVDVALVLRILHGSFAQMFVLSTLVAVAALLSPKWAALHPLDARASSSHRLSWLVFGALLLQLVFGATMRHMGAGLAIPTFPKVSDSAWFPTVHSAAVDTNFTHTRVGAFIVTALIVALSIRILRSPDRQASMLRPAKLLLALVVLQITLGVLVLQIQTPPLQGSVLRWVSLDGLRGLIALTKSIHMFNGALTLATALLLAMRATRVAHLGRVASSPEIEAGRFAGAAV